MKTVSISHTTKTYPRHPYEAIKQAILGSSFELSLVFVGRDRARKLNQETRGKTYIPNVLSFPLSKTQGEIIIAPSTAETEAKKYGLTPKNYVMYLYIHGLLHLKGLKHGAAMEKLEQKYLKKFTTR